MTTATIILSKQKKVVSSGGTVDYFQASSSSSKPAKSEGTWVTNASLTTYSATDRYLYRYSISYGSDGSVLSESDVMLLTVWGEKGNQGEIGNMVYPAGKWVSTSAYSINGKAVPVVLYGDSHYMLISDISASTSGNTTPDQDTAHWKPFNEFQSVWAKIVMSEFGKLASAVFSGDYMFSQQGVDASGNATSDYSGFTNESGTAFQPNILINFLTGLIRSRKGEFIDATIKDCKGINGAFSRIEALSDDGYSQMLLTANLIRFLGQYSSVYMGGDTTPSSGGGVFYVPLRVSVDRSTTGSINANIGIHLSAKGASAYDDVPYSGNHAIYIPEGDICGLRLRTRRISTSQTLSKMDTRILCLANSAITVTLPSGCEDGQMYIIRIMNGKAPVTIAPASGTVCWDGTVSASTYFEDSCTRIVIYDKVNNQWSIGTSAV